MGPENLRLEPIPTQEQLVLELNGFIRFAIMNQTLGKETANRLIDLNEGVIEQDIVEVIPKVRLPERPVAQGLRRASDFAVGEGIYLIADNYRTFTRAEVTEISYGMVVGEVSNLVSVYVSPDFIGLFKESEYDYYTSNKKATPEEGFSFRPHSSGINIELSRLLLRAQNGENVSKSLIEKMRRRFVIETAWRYNLKPEDMQFNEARLKKITQPGA